MLKSLMKIDFELLWSSVHLKDYLCELLEGVFYDRGDVLRRFVRNRNPGGTISALLEHIYARCDCRLHS